MDLTVDFRVDWFVVFRAMSFSKHKQASLFYRFSRLNFQKGKAKKTPECRNVFTFKNVNILASKALKKLHVYYEIMLKALRN